MKEKFRKLDIADETNGWNSFFYRRILINYMFVICPEGNGIDTHRLWEAFYLKTIPVMRENEITPFLRGMNLPILYIHEWSELLNITEKKLKKIYFSKKKFFNNKYLYQSYWKKIIKN